MSQKESWKRISSGWPKNLYDGEWRSLGVYGRRGTTTRYQEHWCTVATKRSVWSFVEKNVNEQRKGYTDSGSSDVRRFARRGCWCTLLSPGLPHSSLKRINSPPSVYCCVRYCCCCMMVSVTAALHSGSRPEFHALTWYHVRTINDETVPRYSGRYVTE